jgi:hypothetical protein
MKEGTFPVPCGRRSSAVLPPVGNNQACWCRKCCGSPSRSGEVRIDQATIAYWMTGGLTWVGIGAWAVCFWWMHRISVRQDALLMVLRELAQTQHEILRELHPDVGMIKEQVITGHGGRMDEIVQQVTHVADAVAFLEATATARPTPSPAPVQKPRCGT